MEVCQWTLQLLEDYLSKPISWPCRLWLNKEIAVQTKQQRSLPLLMTSHRKMCQCMISSMRLLIKIQMC
jgi:hypothetical protein